AGSRCQRQCAGARLVGAPVRVVIETRNAEGSAVTDTRPLRLSVAAPCFNEAEAIESVVAEWDGVLAGVPETTEIVLCNDGSTDGTAGVLERLRTRFPRLRVVHNPTNGGYGRALGSAIDATRGEYVATI